jgi:hypothetical protein
LYHKIDFSSIVEYGDGGPDCITLGYRAARRGSGAMRVAVLLVAAASSGFMAVMFGKTSDNDWGSVLLSVMLAGSAGVLLILAAE